LLALITSPSKFLYFRFLNRAEDNRVAGKSATRLLRFRRTRLDGAALLPGLRVIMTLRRAFVIASLTVLAGGCATENSPAKKPVTSTSNINLTGANGDLKRYLGTWTSNCGREYRATPSGTGTLSSGKNSFSFTAISGNTVEGTLAIDTHESPDCSGPPKRTSAKITMSYIGNVAVGSSFGEGTRYTGSADKLTAIVAGDNGTNDGNTFNIGFLEGFSKFQLAPLDMFSSTNLVYTKMR
jgi:hypothetical protein